jgi:predicted nucleotidyltransferase
MFGFSLYEDFREFIMALNKNAVRYLVVGGYAVVYHGYNRTTGDLDIWVEQTEENYKKLVRAFLDFGFPTNAFSKQDFLDNQKDVYTFGRPPVCIEILTGVKGLEFDSAFQNTLKIKLDEIEVNIIDLPDLLKAKRAANRHKDLDDIQHLTD